ncbi:hypothetical protein MSG28_014271 [Choristoneura fumiferana]|uniref:Uncharacterized protein n=2 Tax=Choristoneura fumiferana TaxID=7141 RepID=A0ACC0JGS5_CHOFU|nr:hypothetical protein MSG28_014271 [Choristoneura fumiferana]KAI8423242.1 hypothetical protein MSG28_014271 [Choristoneura fumiferana]
MAQPAKEGFWKGTPMDGLVEDMRSGCAEGSDPTACIKFKISETVEVTKNGAGNDVTGRANGDFFDNIENFIQSHDVTFQTAHR